MIVIEREQLMQTTNGQRAVSDLLVYAQARPPANYGREPATVILSVFQRLRRP